MSCVNFLTTLNRKPHCFEYITLCPCSISSACRSVSAEQSIQGRIIEYLLWVFVMDFLNSVHDRDKRHFGSAETKGAQ